jgi:hypothetical protein
MGPCAPTDTWDEVPRHSEDRSSTIWSAEERVLALVVAAVLLGVEAVLDRALGGTTVGKVLAWLVGVVIFGCLWIAVVGRASKTPGDG